MLQVVLFLAISSLALSENPVSREKRYLIFPPPDGPAPTKVQLLLGLGLPMEVDVSVIIGYVLKYIYVLPYNASVFTDPYVRYDRSIDHRRHPKADVKAAVASRWELYGILESIFGNRRSGRACLLRAICEAARVPFDRNHGIAGELASIFLTPSSTNEALRWNDDGEYHAAEIAGRRNDRCDRLFPECDENLLEYFTVIID